LIGAVLLGASTTAGLPPVLVQGRADWLASAPGVFAAERGNLAQDTQLSIRGFGARTSFGVRGVRPF